MSHLKLPSASSKQQVISKAKWNEERDADVADFFTVGYVGRSTDVVMEVLHAKGVSTLVDVRQNPVSMYRPDFSKKNLTALLKTIAISYVHLPYLGVPRDVRAKAIDAGSREVIWNWYDEHAVEPFLGRNLHYFLNAFEHPIALMCSEFDPHECHRLALALEHLGLKGYDL